MTTEDKEKYTIEDGTELVDAFRILSDVPQERLLSLTFKLGSSPAERITHAMSLISLGKGTEALDKLHTLEGNSIAKQLSEMVNMCGVSLNDFRVNQTQLPKDNLLDLARIFKLFAEERLCEAFLRDCAYKRALKACRHETGTSTQALEYTHWEQLKEEARKVCGPHIEDAIQDIVSSNNLPSRGYFPPSRELSTALQTLSSSNPPKSLPSSLKTYDSEDSLPSHLEISVPSKAPCEVNIYTSPPTVTPNQLKSPTCDCLENTDKVESKYVKDKTRDHKTNVVEEEVMFYSFVILHAEEDMDLADRLKDKLESLEIGLGATFSQDFAIPGCHTLTCIDNAIDNSAFTILLLTSNFNTRLLEFKTNSALMNSINYQHKYNTVIPFHPKENCLLKERMPKILQSLVPLREDKDFEKRAKKAINPAMIRRQKQVWEKEQMVKEQERRNEKLRLDLKLQTDMIREREEADKLQQKWNPNLPFDKLNTQHSLTTPGTNISINNASCIIIGNNSHMTVGSDCNSLRENN